MTPAPFVIASLPGRGRKNPYVDLFYDALRPAGVVLYAEPEIDSQWAREHFPRIDAIHFHWPEWLWQNVDLPKVSTRLLHQLRKRVPGLWRLDSLFERIQHNTTVASWRTRRVKRLAVDQFTAFLSEAQRHDVRILWTMHNAESHEGWSRVGRRGFQALANAADVIICHSENARQECLTRYHPTCSVIVMAHGNYEGVYPPPRERSEVLSELRLDPALPVVGCIGLLRNYKGIDVALAAIRQLRKPVQFLCAGMPHSEFDLPGLKRLVDQTPHAVLVARRLTDQEFSDLCSACDAVLLPYRKITGSGALLAALSLGRGVIASDLPYFREVLCGHPDAGTLVPANDPPALAEAIQRYLDVAPAKHESAARHLAASYAWPRVVAIVEQEIRRLRRRDC
jgi:glycosyltransferase involved in cell wall biosynthesis